MLTSITEKLKIESVLDALVHNAFITDLDGSLVFMNKEAKHYFNISGDSYIGKNCSILNTGFCNTDRCCIKILKENRNKIQYVDDDKGRCLKVIVTEIFDENSEPLGFLSSAVDITDLRLITNELKVSNERFRIALPHLNMSIFEYDSVSKLLTNAVSPNTIDAGESLTIGVPDELIETAAICEDSKESIREIFRSLDEGIESIGRDIHVLTPEGHEAWHKYYFTNIFDDKGKVINSVGFVSDITEKKSIEIKYRQERKYLNTLIAGALTFFEADLTAGVIVRQSLPSDVSTSASGEDICINLLVNGSNWRISDKDIGKVAKRFSRVALLKTYSDGIREVSEEVRYNKDGKELWAKITARLASRPDNKNVCVFVHVDDISAQKEHNDFLQKQAMTDALTGLDNRFSGVGKATQEIRQIRRGQTYALLMIDIDNFKTVNDTFGHQRGDEFLVLLADTLRSTFRKEDVICRLGGDEFFVFLKDISEKLVLRKTKSLLEFFSNKTEYGKDVSLSIGIKMIGGGEETFDSAYKMADLALYESKKNGKNRYTLYRE